MPDIEGLKNFIGALVLDLFQMRGANQMQAQALADKDKKLFELKAALADLKRGGANG